MILFNYATKTEALLPMIYNKTGAMLPLICNKNL